MFEKVNHYIETIIRFKGGKEKLYGIPTDIIGFDEFGRSLALALEPLVTKKEICYFDLDIQNITDYHFLEFSSMFEKTELMIFTKELPIKYFNDLSTLNPNVLIIIGSQFKNIIEIFKSKGFSKNLMIV